jgi:hypothetical protein
VLFASERGQGRAAFFAARRSKPLTLRSGEYAGEWLCAQQFRAHNHDDKALIPPSQVGQVYERKVGQFLRASRFNFTNAPASNANTSPVTSIRMPGSACNTAPRLAETRQDERSGQHPLPPARRLRPSEARRSSCDTLPTGQTGQQAVEVAFSIAMPARRRKGLDFSHYGKIHMRLRGIWARTYGWASCWASCCVCGQRIS